MTSLTNFDASKISFGQPKVVEGGAGGRAKYIPISFEDKPLKLITPKCFSWGLQKDQLNKNRTSYKVSFVMQDKDKMVTKEHKQFVKVFDQIVEQCLKEVSKHKKNVTK